VLIGYAVLKKTAAKVEPSGFRRRVFTLPVDRDFEPDRGAIREPVPLPPEAVDPLSVQAGKPSRRLRKGEQSR
jgi:hypothetical protein